MILDRVSLEARTTKNQPTRQATEDQSLGWEDPLEKEMATNSTILFFFFFFIFKLYNIVLVLPNIEMNPPQVYPPSPS